MPTIHHHAALPVFFLQKMELRRHYCRVKLGLFRSIHFIEHLCDILWPIGLQIPVKRTSIQLTP